MKVFLAKTYGFCQGVKRAVEIAEKAKTKKKKIFVLREIVHNPQVVKKLEKKGVKSVPSLKRIPRGSTVIFSAHGVSPKVFEEAKKRGLEVIDATCPLVLKVHSIVKKLAKEGYKIIYLGEPDHEETQGILGEAPETILIVNPNLRFKDRELIRTLKGIKPLKLAVITQTTLSLWETQKIIDLLVASFPKILIYNTLCQATTDRQRAVSELAKRVETIVVVGGKRSGNTKRLWETARNLCPAAYWVEEAGELKKECFLGQKALGITAGASTPDWVTREVIGKIEGF